MSIVSHRRAPDRHLAVAKVAHQIRHRRPEIQWACHGRPYRHMADAVRHMGLCGHADRRQPAQIQRRSSASPIKR